MWRHAKARRLPLRADFRTRVALVRQDFVAEGTEYHLALHRPANKTDELARCFQLGDSIIAPVARFATIGLLAGQPLQRIRDQDLACVTSFGGLWESGERCITRTRNVIPHVLTIADFCVPAEGVLADGSVWAVRSNTFIVKATLPRPPGPLLLPSGLAEYTRRTSRPITSTVLARPRQLSACATPRRNSWHPNLVLTQRACGDLVSQLFHCEGALVNSIKTKYWR